MLLSLCLFCQGKSTNENVQFAQEVDFDIQSLLQPLYEHTQVALGDFYSSEFFQAKGQCSTDYKRNPSAGC